MEYVLIIEDDIDFASGFFEKLNEVWIDDFDMLFLNGTSKVQRPHDANWLKWLEGYGAFGYIVHSRFYDSLLEYAKQDKPIDTIYAKFMRQHKVYRLREPIIFHRKGKSDIMGIVPNNYTHLERKNGR